MAEFRGSKIIQKMTLNTHKRCFMGKRTQKTPFCITVILCEKRLKKTLSIREMTSFQKTGQFAKAIAQQNGQ